jgi:hypothetical protein
MKKNRNLKLFGLVFILTVGLVLIGFDIVQGQANTQGKPDKPPGQDKEPEIEYLWTAVILDGQSSIQGRREHTYTGIEGTGSLYDGSEGNINITNVVKVVNPKSPSQVRSDFTLEIFHALPGEAPYKVDFIQSEIGNPDVHFDDIIFRDTWPPISQELNPDLTYKYLGFPLWASAVEDTTGRDADELFDFLCTVNGHPYGPGVETDYYKVRLHFSSAWADSLEGGTYDSWPIGDVPENQKPMGYGGENGNLSIEGQNMARRHCDHGDFNVWNYHNIVGDQHYDGDDLMAGWPGYIVRIAEDTWKVVVDGKINIYEEYCECVTERANKNRPLRTWLTKVRPIYGTCEVHFEMLFIRTEQ